MKILIAIYLLIGILMAMGLEIIFSEGGVGRENAKEDPLMKWVDFDHPIMHLLYFICGIGWLPLVLWRLIENETEKPRE